MSFRGIPSSGFRTISRRAAPFRGAGLNVDDISDEMERCFKKYDRAGFRAVWERFDETLRDLTGDRSFEAYVPHLNKIIYQEVVLHGNCSGYSFLEEGFTSMAWSTRRNARISWAKILRSHVRSLRVGARYRFTRPMFDHTLPNYNAAFAVSSLAFRGMPGRADVSDHTPPLRAAQPPGNTYIILDAIYLFQGVRWEDYEDALVQAVRESEMPSGELLVKFHFADAGARKKFESIRRRLADADIPPMRLLEAGFPVEENLTDQDLVLFAVTALGYYAALAGARVSCFAGNIVGLSIPSLTAGGKLPGDFTRIAGLAGP